MSLTDFLSVYIPSQGYLPPRWLDVRVCNVETVEIYSPSTQDNDPTLSEEEKVVDLQISLADYQGDGYLFLKSQKPCKLPDKIAFTVKDILSDQYADAIEKARDIFRTSSPNIALGKPIFDLELSAQAHNSQKDTQEALEKRREAITSMADSPVTNKTTTDKEMTENSPETRNNNGEGYNGLCQRQLAIAHGAGQTLQSISLEGSMHAAANTIPEPSLLPHSKDNSNIVVSKGILHPVNNLQRL